MEPLPDDATRKGFSDAMCVWGKRLRLSCGKCYEEVTIDMERGYVYLDPDHHGRAAAKFFKKGWRWTDRPICPECIRRGKLS